LEWCRIQKNYVPIVTPEAAAAAEAAALAAAEAAAALPSTEVTTVVEPGEQRLPVESHAGFEVGQEVVIDEGTQVEEVNEVVGFGSLLLKHPLKYHHGVGAAVTVSLTAQLTAAFNTSDSDIFKRRISKVSTSASGSSSVPAKRGVSKSSGAWSDDAASQVLAEFDENKKVLEMLLRLTKEKRLTSEQVHPLLEFMEQSPPWRKTLEKSSNLLASVSRNLATNYKHVRHPVWMAQYVDQDAFHTHKEVGWGSEPVSGARLEKMPSLHMERLQGFCAMDGIVAGSVYGSPRTVSSRHDCLVRGEVLGSPRIVASQDGIAEGEVYGFQRIWVHSLEDDDIVASQKIEFASTSVSIVPSSIAVKAMLPQRASARPATSISSAFARLRSRQPCWVIVFGVYFVLIVGWLILAHELSCWPF